MSRFREKRQTNGLNKPKKAEILYFEKKIAKFFFSTEKNFAVCPILLGRKNNAFEWEINKC